MGRGGFEGKKGILEGQPARKHLGIVKQRREGEGKSKNTVEPADAKATKMGKKKHKRKAKGTASIGKGALVIGRSEGITKGTRRGAVLGGLHAKEGKIVK